MIFFQSPLLEDWDNVVSIAHLVFIFNLALFLVDIVYIFRG